MLSYTIAIKSDQGGRKYNEDACGHWASERQLCCVLADGAGGHGGGDIASRLAVTAMLGGFAQAPTSNGAELMALLRQTNQAVLDGREPTGPRRDMHTTIVGLALDVVTGRADWAHCGDSRLYWFRNGRMVEHTADHSFVQSLLVAGVVREDEVRSHPNRSVLTSALGREMDELDASVTDSSRQLNGGDVLLLCSDGVWEYLPDGVLMDSLRGQPTPEAWLDELERLIRQATQGLPSHDNFTALAVWLQGSADTDTTLPSGG